MSVPARMPSRGTTLLVHTTLVSHGRPRPPSPSPVTRRSPPGAAPRGTTHRSPPLPPQLDPVWTGWMWAGLLAVFGYAYTLMHHQLFFIGMRMGMRMRQQAIAAVQSKVLRLNSVAVSDVTAGKVRVLGQAAARQAVTSAIPAPLACTCELPPQPAPRASTRLSTWCPTMCDAWTTPAPFTSSWSAALVSALPCSLLCMQRAWGLCQQRRSRRAVCASGHNQCRPCMHVRTLHSGADHRFCACGPQAGLPLLLLRHCHAAGHHPCTGASRGVTVGVRAAKPVRGCRLVGHESRRSPPRAAH